MTIFNTKISDELDAYLLELSAKQRKEVVDIYQSAKSVGEFQMQISPLQATVLSFLVKLFNVRNAVEIGSFCGFSAAVIYDSMNSNSVLNTCEVDKFYYEKAKMNLATICTHSKDIFAHHVDGREYLSEVAGTAHEIDMLFLDGDKLNYPDYILWAEKNMPSGALFVMDNALFKGGVLDRNNEFGRSINRANRLLQESPRFMGCYVPVGDCMYVSRLK